MSETVLENYQSMTSSKYGTAIQRTKIASLRGTRARSICMAGGVLQLDLIDLPHANERKMKKYILPIENLII